MKPELGLIVKSVITEENRSAGGEYLRRAHKLQERRCRNKVPTSTNERIAAACFDGGNAEMTNMQDTT